MHGETGDALERVRAMSVAERLALFLELCDLTDSIVDARPDAERLRSPQRRSKESEATWRRLMVSGHAER